MFYKKGKEFADKGLGMLHLKKVDEKTQMIVRAETNLGNILLNIVLNKSMNFSRRGNNVQFSCVPNPAIAGEIVQRHSTHNKLSIVEVFFCFNKKTLADLDPGPVVMLAKVKNADIAAILEEEIKKLI